MAFEIERDGIFKVLKMVYYVDLIADLIADFPL